MQIKCLLINKKLRSVLYWHFFLKLKINPTTLNVDKSLMLNFFSKELKSPASNFAAYLILFFLFSGCASRTKYAPHGNNGGYSDLKSDLFSIARFVGNAFTKEKDAVLLSQFRAYESCFEQGYKVARLYDQKNLTQSKTVQRTSIFNYQNPSYLNGSGNTFGTMLGNSYSGTTNYSGTISGGGSNSYSTS